MIEEQARVVAVGRDHVDVETLRKSSCGQCKANGACGTSLIARVFPERVAKLRVPGFPGVQPGDQVVLGMEEGRLQKASLLLYLLPLVGLIGGAMLPESFFSIENASTAELLSILAGLIGLTAGLFVAGAVSRRERVAQTFEARILRIVSRAQVVLGPR